MRAISGSGSMVQEIGGPCRDDNGPGHIMHWGHRARRAIGIVRVTEGAFPAGTIHALAGSTVGNSRTRPPPIQLTCVQRDK